MAAQLADAGCCIVSGLALGVDAAAHQGALEAGGVTVGVLGGGHRHFFPRQNRALADRMLSSSGAVLSPFEPECLARPWQFLARNGVVAALADAVVVIEAPARSGALNTAGWAAGRIPVLAVPGDVDRKHVAGCHALIRDGATLARNAADVLEALGLNANAAAQDAPEPAHAPMAAAVLAAIDAGASRVDTLVAATGFDPAGVLGQLTLLELEGAVTATGGGSYVRTRAGAQRELLS